MLLSHRVKAWLCAAACLLCVPSVGHAQQDEPQDETVASDSDRAAAQVLFDEGRSLMKADDYAGACAKFSESMRLDRAIGTQLNLANCYEQLGKLASAWINFEEARSRSLSNGQQKRVELASARAEALAGRLSKLKIIITTPEEGLEVTHDGETVGDAQWGTQVPVDGGRHVIEATAPGKKPWRTAVRIDAEGDSAEVVVPTLDVAPVEAAPVDETPTETDNTGLLIGAGVAGGVGLVGIGLGVAFGSIASGKNDDSLAFCAATPNECTAEGVALRKDAFSNAHISTTTMIVGGVGIATGVTLLVIALTTGGDEAGAESGDELAILPTVDHQSAGAHVRMRW